MTLSIPSSLYFISASVNGSSHPVKDGIIRDVYVHNAESEFTFTIKSTEIVVNKQINYQTKKGVSNQNIQEWVDNYYATLAEGYTTFATEAQAQAAIDAGFTIDAVE